MRRAVLTATLCAALSAGADRAFAHNVPDPCALVQPGAECSPGNGRQTPGGGDKVSHEGWPAITGVLWKVLDGSHALSGGVLSDELLGHHGNDVDPRRGRRGRPVG